MQSNRDIYKTLESCLIACSSVYTAFIHSEPGIIYDPNCSVPWSNSAAGVPNTTCISRGLPPVGNFVFRCADKVLIA